MDSQSIWNFMKERQREFESISDQIWDFAEIRFQEVKSAGLLSGVLEQEGFRVERGIAGISTAFMAEYGSGKPVIAFLGEYDALPELSQKADQASQEALVPGSCGHGCGHHLLGAGSLEAVCAVKKLMEQEKVSGTLRYYGCPAEEGGAGKGFMVREGVFRDVDFCLTWHPKDRNGIMEEALANIRIFFDFYGISAHAAGDPWLGRSALDAVELTNVGCNYLREHVVPEARIHYAVTNAGGSAPNVVQSEAQVLYCVRAPKQDQLEDISSRVCNVARGAALMTDTKVEIRTVSAYANLIPNKTMSKMALEQMKQLEPVSYTEEDLAYGRSFQLEEDVPYDHEVRDCVKSGSTDVGDVSWNVPTMSLGSACFAAGTPLHSWRATAQGKSFAAKMGMHRAAAVLAAVAFQLYTDTEAQKKAKKDFENALKGRSYNSLIPKSIKPGDF